MMLLNLGLDIAYVFAGLWLKSLSCCFPVDRPELWFGFGNAVILQGVVLYFNDLLFLNLHKRNFSKARPYLKLLIEGAERKLPPKRSEGR